MGNKTRDEGELTITTTITKSGGKRKMFEAEPISFEPFEAGSSQAIPMAIPTRQERRFVASSPIRAGELKAEDIDGSRPSLGIWLRSPEPDSRLARRNDVKPRVVD